MQIENRGHFLQGPLVDLNWKRGGEVVVETREGSLVRRDGEDLGGAWSHVGGLSESMILTLFGFHVPMLTPSLVVTWKDLHALGIKPYFVDHGVIISLGDAREAI